jgi:hypothetical protein
MEALKNWNRFSFVLFEVFDPEDLPLRVYNWVRGQTVYPFVFLLDQAYNFSDPCREKGENRGRIVQLCVDNEKTGRLIRALPQGLNEYGRNGIYARTIALIVRENNFEGEILADKSWDYRQKCELIFQMIILIQEDCPIHYDAIGNSYESQTEAGSEESAEESAEPSEDCGSSLTGLQVVSNHILLLSISYSYKSLSKRSTNT